MGVYMQCIIASPVALGWSTNCQHKTSPCLYSLSPDDSAVQPRQHRSIPEHTAAFPHAFVDEPRIVAIVPLPPRGGGCACCALQSSLRNSKSRHQESETDGCRCNDGRGGKKRGGERERRKDDIRRPSSLNPTIHYIAPFGQAVVSVHV